MTNNNKAKCVYGAERPSFLTFIYKDKSSRGKTSQNAVKIIAYAAVWRNAEEVKEKEHFEVGGERRHNSA